MPRKIGVFERNREYILNLLKEGWDFRFIALLLTGSGEKTSHQNLHKSYLRYLKKQETLQNEETVQTESLESYIRSHHPKIFKEWLAHRRAATKQMPPVKKGAAKRIDAEAVDRLWEKLEKDPAFKKLGRDKLEAWVRDASENSTARKESFNQVFRSLEREYTDGNLTESRYLTMKGWVEYFFNDSPEAALEFVNANAGKSFEEWRKAFYSAIGFKADKQQQNKSP